MTTQPQAAGVLVVCGMDFEARIAAGPDCQVLHGLRADALDRALQAQLAAGCAGVISFGVAGGLDPALAPGAIVIASGVQDGSRPGHRYPTDPAWTQALRHAQPLAAYGLIAGSDTAAATLADKEALRAASGALVVDMESHIAARAAQSHGVPFAACRIVVDPATRPVPPLALAGMGSDGRTDVGAVVLGLLRTPQQLPALMRLARDASAARTAMVAARRAMGDDFSLRSANR